MDELPDIKDVKKYSLTFSLDKGHFFRHSCSSCGMSFKTKAGLADIATAIQPAFREVGREFGEDLEVHLTSNEDVSESRIYCPYCGHEDETSNMLTDELSRYLERYMMREYVLPKINEMLSDFSDSHPLRQRHSKNIISFEIIADVDRTILPPRPINGPELPDMVVVYFLCCDNYGKILENWIPIVNCPFCGKQTAIM
jgi:transcription elongation factor Elf1